MERTSYIILLLLFICIGCGTTDVIVLNNQSADIYVNGEFIGKGVGQIKRTGTPKKSQATAKYQGQEIGSVLFKRHFDIVTFIGGFYTYGIGFFVLWRYPQTVYIPCESPSDNNSPANKRDSVYKSIWDKPPSKWDK